MYECGCDGHGLRHAVVHQVIFGEVPQPFTCNVACSCDVGIDRFSKGVSSWLAMARHWEAAPSVVEFYICGTKHRADPDAVKSDPSLGHRLTLWERTAAHRRFRLAPPPAPEAPTPDPAAVAGWARAVAAPMDARILAQADRVKETHGKYPETPEDWRKLKSWMRHRGMLDGET